MRGGGFLVYKHSKQAVTSVLDMMVVIFDKVERERWRQVCIDATGRSECLLCFPSGWLRFRTGSKPYSKSTVKLRGCFDCSSPLCWLQSWQICRNGGFLHLLQTALLLCIRRLIVDFALGRCVCLCVCVRVSLFMSGVLRIELRHVLLASLLQELP